MNWILLAILGAIFTSLTTITMKLGVKNINSNFATFYRTGIVILGCIVMCIITGSFKLATSFTTANYIFLSLSGVATGCSWLCYNRALKLSSVNKVAPIDKSSFIITTILFLIFFFDDTTNGGNILTIVMIISSMVLMLVGTMLMISKKDEDNGNSSNIWLLYAILSAVFAAIVALFIKMGLKGVPTNIGTLYRTIIVFIFAGVIVFAKKDYKFERKIGIKTWIFLSLSGLMTGAAWICEYEALGMLQSNPVVVNSISKLSILLTMIFSATILKEKFKIKTLIGLGLLTGGIILIIVFGL